MQWKNWKLGLVVAALTGGLSVFVVGAVAPNMTWKQIAFITIGFVAKDTLLYLTGHPADQVKFQSDNITTKPDGTVSSTTVTVTQPTPETAQPSKDKP